MVDDVLYLVRYDQDTKQTLGRLMFNRENLGFTMELPWLNNTKRISCIPDGDYTVIKHNSPRFGASFWVQDVPDRSEILIHYGNYNRDTLGCILPGAWVKDIDGDGNKDVTSSRAKMREIYGILPDTFTISIATEIDFNNG